MHEPSKVVPLVILRMMIGWHFLYEGIVKVTNPHWTAAEYLAESKGFLSGLFTWLAAEPSRLAAVDFLNKWGLICIGIGLIAGLLTRYATISGMVLLGLYYLHLKDWLDCIRNGGETSCNIERGFERKSLRATWRLNLIYSDVKSNGILFREDRVNLFG